MIKEMLTNKEYRVLLKTLDDIPTHTWGAEIYNAKMESLFCTRMYDRIPVIFDQMLSRGCTFNPYNLLRCIEAFANLRNNGDRCLLAFSMLEETPGFVLKRHHYSMTMCSVLKFDRDFSDVNSIIEIRDTVHKLFFVMTDRGITPSKLCFESLLHAEALLKNNLENFQNVWSSMETNSFQPDLSAYCSLAIAFSNSGQFDRAVQVLKQFEKKREALPTASRQDAPSSMSKFFEIWTKGVAIHKDWESCAKIRSVMSEFGVKHNNLTIRTYCNELVDKNDVAGIKKFLLDPNYTHGFRAREGLKAFTKTGPKSGKIFQLFTQLSNVRQRSRNNPDFSTHQWNYELQNAIVFSCGYIGKIHSALNILSKTWKFQTTRIFSFQHLVDGMIEGNQLHGLKVVLLFLEDHRKCGGDMVPIDVLEKVLFRISANDSKWIIQNSKLLALLGVFVDQ